MARPYNFSAGPAMLPESVLNQAREEMLDWHGSGMCVAEMSHRGSILCLPTGMHAWPVTTPAAITLESLQPVFDAADQLDVLLVGLGGDIAGFDKAIREALRARSIIVEAIATGGAVRTYNILLAEDRAVGAALIAVDSATR